MKVLVTGGAGFIGSAVCRHLIATGDTVVNVDKLTYAGTLTSLDEIARNPAYTFVHGDIGDGELMRRLFSEHQPDGVLHLAAESHVDRSIDGPSVFIETNIVGTYVLLQAAREYWAALPSKGREAFRFVHVSTDEVYGSLGADGLFKEDTAYAPTSPYSASKASSDHLALAWQHTFGLPVVVSNCSNNYGPFHFPEKLIPLATINALQGRPVDVYGSGKNIRDWLYVEDHASALRLVLEKGRPGEKYNIGGRNERTNLQVVTSICDLLDELAPRLEKDRRSLIRFVSDRPGHDMRYAIDASKIENELGWNAQHTFETGLRRTVEWYLSREDWWLPLRERHSGARIGTPPQAL